LTEDITGRFLKKMDWGAGRRPLRGDVSPLNLDLEKNPILRDSKWMQD